MNRTFAVVLSVAIVILLVFFAILRSGYLRLARELSDQRAKLKEVATACARREILRVKADIERAVGDTVARTLGDAYGGRAGSRSQSSSNHFAFYWNFRINPSDAPLELKVLESRLRNVVEPERYFGRSFSKRAEIDLYVSDEDYAGAAESGRLYFRRFVKVPEEVGHDGAVVRAGFFVAHGAISTNEAKALADEWAGDLGAR